MKNKTLIATITLILVIMIAIGFSYAYFTANISGEESSETLTVTGGSLSISVDGGNLLNIQNVIPGPEAKVTKVITLTGLNTADLIMPYTMSLVIENNSFSDNTISYTLESDNISDNGTIITSVIENQGLTTGSSTIELGKGNYDKGSNLVHEYRLKIYFKETDTDQNSEQGKSISGYIKLEAGEALDLTKTLAYNILGKNNSNVSTPLTTPGRDVSLTNEAVLAEATDDYGTSYYYRGSVQNNYVVFANMCWRIVRVVGDGSIKIVLYNYNPNAVANPCDEDQDGIYRAFSTEYSTSSYAVSKDRNAYLGFMYGNSASSTYSGNHENLNKNVILNKLEPWYTSKLASVKHMLADTIWCNDKSINSGTGIGATTTTYGGYGRLFDSQNANPSLVCPPDNNEGTLSKFTVDDIENGNGALDIKIGLLTADEVVFAGSRYGNGNSNYYLNKNATAMDWWTMTPHLGSGFSKAMILNNSILTSKEIDESGGIRPAISLLSKTMISEGSGTSSNPYIIQT